jgi:hypothetical protein
MIYVLFVCNALAGGQSYCQVASPPLASLQQCRQMIADETPRGGRPNPYAKLVCAARIPEWTPIP